MNPMSSRRLGGACLVLLGIAVARAVAAQSPTPVPTPRPTPVAAIAPAPQEVEPVNEEVVVSSTKIPQEPIDIPGNITVVSGDELRRRGTTTLAQALQDVVGLDTGEGSDNGPRLPNIGLYGIKEFDALMVTVDGVPVGGPFNPNLAQVPVENIDRIEISRGPQGTLYGVSAFAGMIAIFTKQNRGAGDVWGSARVGGFGAFEQGYGQVNVGTQVNRDLTLNLSGWVQRGDGWRERTDFARDQLLVSANQAWGQTKLGVSVLYLRDTNFWGSPLPVDAGQPVPGFQIDNNYAVGGARVDHHTIGVFTNFSTPISRAVTFENVLGFTQDTGDSIRSWTNGYEGNTATAEGIALYPTETTWYEDAHVVASFQAAGSHQLVAGAALTWGRTVADGHGFDFELQVSPTPVVPNYGDIPYGDNRSFNDQRTFIGLYANEQWTPVWWFTLSGGARYDITSETLHVFQQEIGNPNFDVVDEKSDKNAWSGGVGGVFRALQGPKGLLSAANLYVSYKSNFKPSAPNLSEAESAEILLPETTQGEEVGLKTSWCDNTFSFNVTAFHYLFNNLVVSILDPNGQPALTNAGKERFQGVEFEAGWAMPFLEGLSFYGGYAHHDARFVQFTFFTPDGQYVDVGGNRLELVPRDFWNFKFVLAPPEGVGGFVALRHQNHRPLNRRNTFYTPSFYSLDAGVSFGYRNFLLSVTGRNLTDSRPYTTESEIGDSQFYVAPPRGVSAELTFRF
jgi:outer membrane receptor protein involved in Fe transport